MCNLGEVKKLDNLFESQELSYENPSAYLDHQNIQAISTQHHEAF